MTRVLDRLDEIEAAVPGLKGRLDQDRVAVTGHSAGAWTTSMLLGASNKDPRNGAVWENSEKRMKAGVVLAGVGHGGADLSESGKKLVPFFGFEL